MSALIYTSKQEIILLLIKKILIIIVVIMTQTITIKKAIIMKILKITV